MAAEKTDWITSPKVNDLHRREWRYRLIRRLRHLVRRLSSRALMWADEPRVLQAWRRGWDEDHFTRLLRLRDHGFRPRTVFDIGAHTGSWAAMSQALFSPQSIFLFEPQAQCLQEIEQRRLALQAPWQVVPAALGDENSLLTLTITRNRAASSLLAPKANAESAEIGTDAKATETVQVKRLDDLAREGQWPWPDLVKIDVQGFEKQVMKGGENTLAHAEWVVVEVSLRPIYEGQALLPEILNIFIRWGFELADINETFRPWPGGDLWQVDLWLRRPSAL